MKDLKRKYVQFTHIATLKHDANPGAIIPATLREDPRVSLTEEPGKTVIKIKTVHAADALTSYDYHAGSRIICGHYTSYGPRGLEVPGLSFRSPACRKLRASEVLDVDYRADTRPCGGSDIATLIAAGPAAFDKDSKRNGMTLAAIPTHEDGAYRAHVVHASELWTPPAHYSYHCTCSHWVKVYDDARTVLEESGDLIRVYASGKTILIHVINYQQYHTVGDFCGKLVKMVKNDPSRVSDSRYYAAMTSGKAWPVPFEWKAGERVAVHAFDTEEERDAWRAGDPCRVDVSAALARFILEGV